MSAEGNGSNGNGNTADNTADGAPGIPFSKGFDPRRGHGLKGRAGRPVSEIREKVRGSFDQRIAILEEIADNPESDDSDRIKAVDLLGKYGLGTTVTETDTEGHDAIRVIREPMRLRSVD